MFQISIQFGAEVEESTLDQVGGGGYVHDSDQKPESSSDIIIGCLVAIFVCIMMFFIMYAVKKTRDRQKYSKDVANVQIQDSVVVSNRDTINESHEKHAEVTKGKDVEEGRNISRDERIWEWLSGIEMAKYCDLFVKNGYDNFDFIKEIRDVKELEDIDITSQEDQLRILKSLKDIQEIVVEHDKVTKTNGNIEDFEIVSDDDTIR